jgi:hypothetical protein
MSHSDSGHLGNLKSFDELLSAVRGFSAGYNPSKDEFRINALEVKSAEGHNQITNMNVRMSAYKSAVEHRAMIYLPFQNLTTSIFNYVKSTDASDVNVDNVGQIIRKLKGQRAGKKVTPPAGAENQQASAQISVSQLSFNEQLNNFDRLIRQLEMIPQYVPNETHLSIAGLRDYYNRMNTANEALLKAENDLSNARLSRNKEFYDPETGLVEIGKGDKLYIKAIFGATSPQYRQVSGISFKSYGN